MDKPIEKKRWTPRRIVVFSAIGGIALVLAYFVISTSGHSRVDIDSAHVTVAQVQRGEFQEYVSVEGTVLPSTSVYLDVEEGGIVEKIYVEGGNPVKKGDLILSFSNTAAQKENIDAETRLIDNLNQLRNSKISLTESNLILKDQLLDLEYNILDLEKTFTRYQQLMKSPNSQLSKEQFETTRDKLIYLKNKRDLLQERIRRETDLQEQQSTQVDASIKRVNRNLDLLTHIVDSLEIRAPIDGHLSTLSAEVGQSFQRGQRIGQIDQLDQFKVRADIDQYYISRVSIGQHGKFDFGGRTYEVETTKIYPEVEKDVFHADLVFVGTTPEGIKRGQTLQIDLALSEPKTTNLVAKGTFYQHTTGRWAYVLNDDGRAARRTNIVLGRQNPQQVEVLEGLKVGDWIITSDYGKFGDVEYLTFPASIKH